MRCRIRSDAEYGLPLLDLSMSKQKADMEIRKALSQALDISTAVGRRSLFLAGTGSTSESPQADFGPRGHQSECLPTGVFSYRRCRPQAGTRDRQLSGARNVFDRVVQP
jgi:hypothetical protein